MRDQTYFPARAILEINTIAGAQPHECTFRYPIPAISWNSFQRTTDPNLYHVLLMLKLNFGPDRPTLDFSRAGTNQLVEAEERLFSSLNTWLTRPGLG